MRIDQIKNVPLNITELRQEKRILIVGNVGSGKTTIGKAIAEDLEGLLFEIDCANLTAEELNDIIEKIGTKSLMKRKRIYIMDELQNMTPKQASRLLIPLQRSFEDIIIGISSRTIDELRNQSESFKALISRLSYVIEVNPTSDIIRDILVDNGFSLEEANTRARACNGDMRNALFGTKINQEIPEDLRAVMRNPQKFIINWVFKNRFIHTDACLELLRVIDSMKNPLHLALTFSIIKIKFKIK